MNLIAICILVISIVPPTLVLSGEEILEKMDFNRDYETIAAKATMTIYIDDKIRTKYMSIKSIIKKNKSIVEFTNTEDRGTKYLMLGDDLWIYFADEQDVIKISGHMLKDGMMGSDVSYEDALESDILSNKYTTSLTAEESIGNVDCYVLLLEANVKDVPYYKRKMWVSKEYFIAMKEEMYAKSGKLLKVSNVLEVRKVGKRMYPVKSEIINQLRKNSKTVFETTDIELDIPLDENEFSMRYLRR